MLLGCRLAAFGGQSRPATRADSRQFTAWFLSVPQLLCVDLRPSISCLRPSVSVPSVSSAAP
jgi:hypothetical protein